MVQLRPWIAAAAFAALAFVGISGSNSSSLGLRSAAAQDTFTPMPLDSGFGPMNLSAPAIPPEQIIQRFAAKETEFQDALNHYTYRRTARVDTLDDDNKVTGEWYEVDDVVFDPTGRRTERVVDAPPSTLENGGIMMSPSDLHDIEYGYPFVLTTADLPKYNIKYVGRQKVDELECYVFDVAPKVIEKRQRYLDGRIWVDSQDLQIVVTDGRMVPDDTKRGQEDLHPPFMTWRQQIDGHYWFPVYTKGEGWLHFAGGYGYMAQDVHIRDVVKYSDYKRFGSTSKIFYGGKEIDNTGKPQNQQPQPPPQK
ncbi:MAG: hypothetical protein ACP5E2_04085 [Terracidiphilus sp.]